MQRHSTSAALVNAAYAGSTTNDRDFVGLSLGPVCILGRRICHRLLCVSES